ncbi:MAG: LysM peptidoglycan-binding domain-containing protein [Clostridia bacterium]|nr:LysM peptidoglycan-binding domain-containing protein [Clostridia bacterium]
MRFKSYVWPHNPKVFEIEFLRVVRSHKVPFGMYSLQSMGRTNRVFRGEGEFVGPGAYDEFKKLASVFCDNTPGVLVHPVWQTVSAYFVELSLKQEPEADFVSYAFEFWECFDGNSAVLTKVSSPSGGSLLSKDASEETWYTVVAGDCLFSIAAANDLTLDALIALNPRIKNPNLIYAGDMIRLS